LVSLVFGVLVFKLSVWCGVEGYVPETCWASNKICNKNHLLHLVGILFPQINDDARSKSYQIHLTLLRFVRSKYTGTCRMNPYWTLRCYQYMRQLLTSPICRGSVTVWPGHQCSAYCIRHKEGCQITALKFNAAKSRTARYLH
jgi:hypothetical protein